MSQINVYVGEDNKLHFVDCEGADSVLPFSHPTKISGLFYAYLPAGNMESYTIIDKLENADITKLTIRVNRQIAGQTYIRVISIKEDIPTTIIQYTLNSQPPLLNGDIEFEISGSPDSIKIEAETISGGIMQYTTVQYIIEFAHAEV